MPIVTLIDLYFRSIDWHLVSMINGAANHIFKLKFTSATQDILKHKNSKKKIIDLLLFESTSRIMWKSSSTMKWMGANWWKKMSCTCSINARYSRSIMLKDQKAVGQFRNTTPIRTLNVKKKTTEKSEVTLSLCVCCFFCFSQFKNCIRRLLKYVSNLVCGNIHIDLCLLRWFQEVRT